MNKSKSPLLWLALCMMLSSCYKESVGDLFVNDLDIVVTAYDKTFDFNPGVQSFVMPDEVLALTNDGVADNNGNFDEEILARIRANLVGYGYEDKTDSTNNEADLAVIVMVIEVDNYVIGPGYPWWGWWGSYYSWYPGWGGGGWYYPYPTVVGSYRTGTLLVDIGNPSELNAEDEIPIVWNGALNGLLEGSNAGIQSRIISGIDQMFEQSPYLAN